MPFLTRKQRNFACGVGICLLLQYEHTKRHIGRVYGGLGHTQGLANNLIPELKQNDPQSFQNFFR